MTYGHNVPYDRLDTFIHALEHYATMNQPADLLDAVIYARLQLANADERELPSDGD
jgi:hypothetical protein